MTPTVLRQSTMPATRPEWGRTDSQRDAAKYRQLVRALRHATNQARRLETQGGVNIEEVLAEMLPDIAMAFQGESAFIAHIQHDVEAGQSTSALILNIHPATVDHTGIQQHNPLLEEVLMTDQPRVIDSLGGETQTIIAGLEFCQATSAILVPVRILDRQYVVGICNKQEPQAIPFLAGDRMTLENLLELIAIGGRAGERRRRELESIEHISKIAIAGDSLEVADAIVYEAVAVTDSAYAALWTVNRHTMQMEFLTVHHAHDPDWQPRRRTLDLNETSFIGFVAARNKILHVQDVDEATRYLQWDPETRSALCIPLVLNQQQVVGVLYVASHVVGGITSERRRFLEQLAPHGAIALHNARTGTIRQRVIRFQQDISDVLPLNEQLDQMLAHLRQQVDTDGFFLAMYNAEIDEISFPLVFDRGHEVTKEQKTVGRFYGPRAAGKGRLGFVEWVLQYRKPLLVENFAIWPQRYSIDPVDRHGVKSCVIAPLMRQERIVGAIGLRSYFDSLGHFDEYDQLFLEGIADQIAIILSNSQHYDATQQTLKETNRQLTERVRALRAVSEFQRRISDINEEQEEIQSIYPELRDAMEGIGLDVSNMYIALYDEEADTISFPLAYEHGLPITETVRQGSELYASTPFGEHLSVAEWIMQRWQNDGIRDALLIEADFHTWIEAHAIRAFPTNTLCWLGAPMICKDKLLGMIGLRNRDREYAFKEEHKELLETIAAQAAVAIDNARLYETQLRDASYFKALHETGRAITRAGLDLDDVLQAILEQAATVTNSFFGTIQLLRGDYLEFVAAWPKSTEAPLMEQHHRMSIDGKGITVRAARLNDAQLIPDVSQDDEYIDATGGRTGSALAVVLRHDGDAGAQPMGVLNVEHHEVGGLTMRDRSVLIGLSNLAVVAVENAQNADQLSRTNAVAVMGAWGADIVHDIHREVGVIRLILDTLRSEHDIPQDLLEQRINEIDECIKSLVMPPLPDPAASHVAAPYERFTVPIDQLVAAEVDVMRRQHGGVIFALETSCPQIEAKIHEQWLRRLLRHLVVNSISANQGERDLVITVGTEVQHGHVEIWVKDNGRGIRPEIESYLFHRPVPHAEERKEERHGRGLLLVRHIVELHGGTVKLKWNEVGEGVCVAFTMPRIGNSP